MPQIELGSKEAVVRKTILAHDRMTVKRLIQILQKQNVDVDLRFVAAIVRKMERKKLIKPRGYKTDRI